MTPAAIQVLAAGFASKFDEIGPYVGFASLVAVAAMGVLVLTQGRELQRLREWAGTAPERLEELAEKAVLWPSPDQACRHRPRRWARAET